MIEREKEGNETFNLLSTTVSQPEVPPVPQPSFDKENHLLTATSLSLPSCRLYDSDAPIHIQEDSSRLSTSTTFTSGPALILPEPASIRSAPAKITAAPAKRTSASATRMPAPATRTPAPATRTPAPATRTPAPATIPPMSATNLLTFVM